MVLAVASRVAHGAFFLSISIRAVGEVVFDVERRTGFLVKGDGQKVAAYFDFGASVAVGGKVRKGNGIEYPARHVAKLGTAAVSLAVTDHRRVIGGSRFLGFNDQVEELFQIAEAPIGLESDVISELRRQGEGWKFRFFLG